MSRRITLVLLACCATFSAVAQEGVYINGNDTLRYTYTPLTQPETPSRPDTMAKRSFFGRIVDYFGQATVDKTFEQKVDFTIAGGPSYSQTTSFDLSLFATGLYRVDRTDSVTPPSYITATASLSVTGVYSLKIDGNTILDHDRQRIDYKLLFSSTPRDMWGIGYAAGLRNDEFSYTEKQLLLRGSYLHRVLPAFYVGASLHFQYTKGKGEHLDSAWETDPLLGPQNKHYTATGIGAIVEYDSRDFIPNPSRGLYLSLQEQYFPEGLGDCGQSFWRTSVTMDGYQRLWKGGLLATDLYGEFNSSGTPWPMLARMGGMLRMRGYYEGRYTDNCLIAFQTELRQHIWRRFGCVVWGGAGTVFSRLDRFAWNEVLPNYGLGIRWEFKQRVNVRLDYGFGKRTSGFLLTVNEAF